MAKKNEGRYTLKYMSVYNWQTTSIPLRFEGEMKTNVPLTTIDAFTSNFSDEKELLSYLQNRGYNFFDGNFQIEYKYKGKIRTTSLIFNDQETLVKLANENVGKYHVTADAWFHSYEENFMHKILTDQELCEFLKNNHYVWEVLITDIKELFLHKSSGYLEGIFEKQKTIKRQLVKYKTIRDIEVGIKKYEQSKEKETIEEIPEEKPKQKVITPNAQMRLFDPDNY